MSKTESKTCFQTEASNYWNEELCVVPVLPGTKQGVKGWNYYQNSLPSPKKRAEWLEACGSYGIAMLTGVVLPDGTRLAGVDIDQDDYVEPIKKIIGIFPSAKKGKKGLTIFVRVPKETKSLAIPKRGDRVIDLLAANKMCVMPGSIF